MSIKIVNALMLAGALAAMSAAAYATEAPPTGVGDYNRHASRVPACGDQYPAFADDTGPGTAGDHNGRRSAARPQGDAEFRVAGGRGGLGGEV